MSLILNTVYILVLGVFARKVYNIRKNIVAAKLTGLPYVLTPALETEVIGHILDPILRRYYYDYLLKGHGWPRWCRFIIREWAWEDHRRSHDEFGDVFLVVSPEGIICYSTDAVLNAHVTSKRQEFVKPPDKYKILEAFGPNLATVEGNTFRQHSKITAPVFSSRTGVEEIVWNETRRQTEDLVAQWFMQPSSSFHLDVTALSLAVFLRAGYGKDIEWASLRKFHATFTTSRQSHLSIFDAVTGVLEHMVPILLLPQWLLRWVVPKAAFAYAELRRHFQVMIDTEKAKAQFDDKKGCKLGNAHLTLLTSVVRASEQLRYDEPDSRVTGGQKEQSFSDEEIMGNLFIFLVGGIETTANAMLYGLISLALFPDIQTRVTEAVDAAHDKASKEGRALSFQCEGEQLRYLYAFMYEVLRVFPGVIWITKMIQKPTTVSLSSSPIEPPRSIELPADCRVYLNVPGTQKSPEHWSEPERFHPERWLKYAEKDPLRKLPGKFIGFSDGARGCPGRGFAYTEFVAFFVTLLKEYRVSLAEGLDRESVERDVFWRSAGMLTLSPPPQIQVRLERRPKAVP